MRLSDATALHVGDTPAVAAYVGDQQVWSSVSSGLIYDRGTEFSTFSVVHLNDTDNQAEFDKQATRLRFFTRSFGSELSIIRAGTPVEHDLTGISQVRFRRETATSSTDGGVTPGTARWGVATGTNYDSTDHRLQTSSSLAEGDSLLDVSNFSGMHRILLESNTTNVEGVTRTAELFVYEVELIP